MNDVIVIALLVIGAGFFIAGTVGVLRFPDVYTRLHALTKADNLGLGFVCAALALEAQSLRVAVELIAIWALVLIGSSFASQLIASAAMRAGIAPWTKP